MIATVAVSEQVAQLLFFGFEIGFIVGVGFYLDRQSFDDLYISEALYFPGIVGQQFQFFDTKMPEDKLHDLVGTLIGRKTKLMIGLYCIVAAILESIGVDLVEQPDIPALLAMIDQHPALFCDQLQSKMELLPAIAFDRSQSVTGQAFGVHSDDGSIRKRIGKKRQMLLLFLFERLYFKGTVFGRQGSDLRYFNIFHGRIILY